ncbi:MAG: DUF1848 domain-containing protein [Lachnospiraceae bacterium]|nr:DUF1848 domain-containing protein [Lachnospiraceae bacterium]
MILSVSRRTDIPNYYSDWFYERIKDGYLYVRNPINIHQISKININPDVVDCIVFWTKNPMPMMKRLDELNKYKYYFQFTLTGYGKDIEPNVPHKKNNMISTFIELSNKIGKNKVIWRYDPILINDTYTLEYHEKAFKQIAEQLHLYTNKVVISFIDLYTKTQRNTKDLSIKDISSSSMHEIAGIFSNIAKQYNLKIESCAEKVELSQYGISHGSCIDKITIEDIIGSKLICDKDKNQRIECGCVESIDIGTYNTCKNGCKYCYANFNDNKVIENSKLFDINSPLLCSTISEKDVINERNVKSIRDNQLSLF